MRTMNLVFPVQNDECRLIRGIRRTTDFCNEYFPGRYRITIEDCGSADGTERLGRSLAACCPHVEYIRTDKSTALSEALRANTCDVIGFLGIDLSGGLEHLLFADQMFENNAVGAINGSRYRRLSIIRVQRTLWKAARRFRAVWKLLFRVSTDDPLCHFKLFRRETAEQLVPFCGNFSCWTACSELTLRAERSGVLVRELTVDWMEPTFDPSLFRSQRVLLWRETVRLWLHLHSH